MIDNSNKDGSGVGYSYVTMEQLPISTYNTIKKMAEGGWARKEGTGKINSRRIRAAYPQIKPDVIDAIVKESNIDENYIGIW